MAGLDDSCWALASAGFYFNILAFVCSPLDKAHNAVTLGKQRVVLATPDVPARVETCATLANNDIASQYRLTAETLHAESF